KDDGKEYPPKDGRFPLLFPRPPKETVGERGPGVHTVLASRGQAELSLMYQDLPAEATATGVKAVYDELTKQQGTSLHSKKDIEQAGLPGLEAVTSVRGGDYVVRFFLIENRLYGVGV